MTPPEVLIAADDRTGALEVAGSAAEALGAIVPVVVGTDRLGVGSEGSSGEVVVVDLASRHLPPAAAHRLAQELDGLSAGRHVHKIDSTLRGNWAHELVARAARGSRPVLLVPALPALGRTCVGGVVQVDGRPVHEGPAADDPDAPPVSSRPADLLSAAGASAVRQLSPRDVEAWADDPVGIAVCDAESEAQLAFAVRSVLHRPHVLLAGTSAVVRYVVESRRRDAARGPASNPAPVRPTASSCLVVCGSLHPVAREQVIDAGRHGAHVLTDGAPVGEAPADGRPVILLTPPRPSGRIDSNVSSVVATGLARRSRELAAQLGVDATIVIGGDTAAAVLGDGDVHVGGLVAPGAPWTVTDDGRLVVTRAGGFGGPDALRRLIEATLGA